MLGSNMPAIAATAAPESPEKDLQSILQVNVNVNKGEFESFLRILSQAKATLDQQAREATSSDEKKPQIEAKQQQLQNLENAIEKADVKKGDQLKATLDMVTPQAVPAKEQDQKNEKTNKQPQQEQKSQATSQDGAPTQVKPQVENKEKGATEENKEKSQPNAQEQQKVQEQVQAKSPEGKTTSDSQAPTENKESTNAKQQESDKAKDKAEIKAVDQDKPNGKPVEGSVVQQKQKVDDQKVEPAKSQPEVKASEGDKPKATDQKAEGPQAITITQDSAQNKASEQQAKDQAQKDNNKQAAVTSSAAAEKQASDKQASDKQASAKQASDKQASDKQASDKQASDKQASDKQASDKQVSDKQASDKQASQAKAPAEQKAQPEKGAVPGAIQATSNQKADQGNEKAQQVSGAQAPDKKEPTKQEAAKKGQESGSVAQQALKSMSDLEQKMGVKNVPSQFKGWIGLSAVALCVCFAGFVIASQNQKMAGNEEKNSDKGKPYKDTGRTQVRSPSLAPRIDTERGGAYSLGRKLDGGAAVGRQVELSSRSNIDLLKSGTGANVNASQMKSKLLQLQSQLEAKQREMTDHLRQASEVINVLEVKLDAAREEGSRLTIELEEARETGKQQAEAVRGLEGRVAEMNKVLTYKKSQNKGNRQDRSVATLQSEYAEQLDNLKEVKAKRVEIDNFVIKRQAEIAEKEEQYRELENEYQVLTFYEDEIKELKDKLNEERELDAIERAMTEKLQIELKRLQSQQVLAMDRVRVQFNKTRKLAQQLQNEIDSLQGFKGSAGQAKVRDTRGNQNWQIHLLKGNRQRSEEDRIASVAGNGATNDFNNGTGRRY